MPYRKLVSGATWHWCLNCSAWPLGDFRQREDKPPTWDGQSLCEECGKSDSCGSCRHSADLRTGLASDSALGSIPASP